MAMKKYPLSTKGEIPAMGLGTWVGHIQDTAQIKTAAAEALRIGYRHFDTAALYRSERDLGEAIRESGIPREEIFVTSKLWNTAHTPEDVPKAFEKTMNNLDIGYLDLYLMHYPCATLADASGKDTYKHVDIDFKETWAAMEKLVDSGRVRNIGISNFARCEIEELMASARIPPVVHQFELHPYLPQTEFVKWNQKVGINVTAYTPLGVQKPGMPVPFKAMEHPRVLEAAKKADMTPAQVIIAWHIARGCSVIPKTSNLLRLKENWDGSLKPLTKEVLEILDGIDVKYRSDDDSVRNGYWLYRDLDPPGAKVE